MTLMSQQTVKIVKEYDPTITVVVDNTFLTPHFQRPLELGADAVMHSITKYLNGHSDVVMGCVICRDTGDTSLYEKLKFTQMAVGMCLLFFLF